MTTAPTLTSNRVRLRPGTAADAPLLHSIRSEPGVQLYWMTPDPLDRIVAALAGEDSEVVFVIEVAGQVAGAIQYLEENDPDYRHASIDIYLGEAFQGRRLGPEAIQLLAAYLIDSRGHHRLTLDPAVVNERAIRSYQGVGFRPVGVLRQYERDLSGTWRDALFMDLLAEELLRDPFA